MIIGYVRVSTVDQNEARQMETMKNKGVEKIFLEKQSAKDTARPELQNMLGFAREGDTIIVHELSRIARNTKDLLQLVEDLKARGIALVSAKEAIDSSTATGKLMLTMIGAIAEFERSNLLERQREGIAIAKQEGKYQGKRSMFKSEEFKQYYDRYKNRDISKMALAAELGVSRTTLDKYIREYEEQL